MSGFGMDTPHDLTATVRALSHPGRSDVETNDLAEQIRSDILGVCPGTTCSRTPAARPG